MRKNLRRMTALFLCAAMMFTTNYANVRAAEDEEPQTEEELIPELQEEESIPALQEAELIPEPQEAEKAFSELASSKNLMALVYLTDACEVKAEPDAESSTTAVLGSGYTVYVKSVCITEENVWYGVSFWSSGEEQCGYVEEQYLAYADEDWSAWREKEMLPALVKLLFGEDADIDPCGIMTYNVDRNADIEVFPAAFQGKLQEMKDAHPAWIFVPVKTGLDFDAAVSAEMGDRSWISNTASNRDAGFVGEAAKQSGWSYATKKAVSYYMDTENYLDETHIFAFEQLTFNGSYHSEAAVQAFLDGTFMRGSLPDDGDMTYAHAFYTIGESRKLSPTHLASRVYQEQGKGTSPLISGKYPGYEGYYNYYNIGATGSGNEAVIKNGLEYARDQGWDTAYKSLSGGAATIGNNYILKGQDTGYLQKFNVAPGAGHATYTHQYMQNIQAPWSEAVTTKKIYKGAGSLNSAFVFKIPIYGNMPGEETETEIPPEPEPEPVPEPEPEPLPEEIRFPADGFFVVPVGRCYFTGNAIKPQVTVYDAEAYEEGTGSRTPLVLNQDYTVSYKNNIKVNTADSPVPVVIVKGKGNYGGTQEIPFDILPVSLTRSDIRTDYEIRVKYTGDEVKASPVVMRDGVKLVRGKDYTVSYPETGDNAYVRPGTYKIEITGMGGYTGTRTVYEIITRSAVTTKKSISKAAVTGVESKVYTGMERDVRQTVRLTLNGETLTESIDGGQGDFITVYKNTGKAGTAAVEFHGIGGYTGTLKKTFKIEKADLQTLAAQGSIAINCRDAYPYVKGKVTPAITVQYIRPDGKRRTLVKGTDYTVSYKNNGRVTSGAGMSDALPTIIVKGKGNFKGTVTHQFTITDGQFENMSKVAVNAKDVIYKKKTGFYRTSVSAIDANGKALKAGTDYAKPDEYTYVGIPNVVDAAGDPVARGDGEPVAPEDLPLPGTTIRVRVKAMGAYAPDSGREAVRYADYRIVAADISKANVRVKAKTYLSGRPVTLTADDLTVILNGEELVCGRDYVIDETTYRNNTAKGTASVVIRGCGTTAGADGNTALCGGSKTVKYTIGSRWFVW